MYQNLTLALSFDEIMCFGMETLKHDQVPLLPSSLVNPEDKSDSLINNRRTQSNTSGDTQIYLAEKWVLYQYN